MGTRPETDPAASSGRLGIHAPVALLPSGWANEVEIEWDESGHIHSVATGRASSSLPRASGPVVCGMPNLHSHAFQRLLVGRTQDTIAGDDFWSWRTRMYEAVASLSLDDLEAVSAWLFSELVASGYTSVVEFHYVHRPDGKAPEAAAVRLLRAARAAGIRMTLAPVLYRWTGFDRRPLEGNQRVFQLNCNEYAQLYRFLSGRLREDPLVALACAPHSLRAVNGDDLHFLLDLVGPTTPVHIHVSEQVAEVESCSEHLGKTPIEWLMDHADVDRRWGLVHCTQATPRELESIRASGATTILCPTTEHDLGDGRFPAEGHLGANFGIGSDSQVSISPMEELRTILYGMRAASKRRAVLDDSRPAGAVLWQEAAGEKESVVGQPVGAIASGYTADLLVLDASAPLLAGLDPDQMLSALVLSGDSRHLQQVLVGGTLVAAYGRHVRHDAIAEAWREAISRLGLSGT